jgi:hypothetical protein
MVFNLDGGTSRRSPRDSEAFIRRFTERRDRADFTAFDKIMKRKGGQVPEPEDRMP